MWSKFRHLAACSHDSGVHQLSYCLSAPHLCPFGYLYMAFLCSSVTMAEVEAQGLQQSQPATTTTTTLPQASTSSPAPPLLRSDTSSPMLQPATRVPQPKGPSYPCHLALCRPSHVQLIFTVFCCCWGMLALPCTRKLLAASGLLPKATCTVLQITSFSHTTSV